MQVARAVKHGTGDRANVDAGKEAVVPEVKEGEGDHVHDTTKEPQRMRIPLLGRAGHLTTMSRKLASTGLPYLSRSKIAF
eukprot:2794308-Amphidinium_carterae.1